MTVKRIQPMPGRMIPYPTPPHAPIPPEGCRVEWPGPSSYWVRRLNEGVIRIVPDVQGEVVPAPSPKAKKE